MFKRTVTIANPMEDTIVTAFSIDSDVLPLFFAKKVSAPEDINFKPSVLLLCIKTETIITPENISCKTTKKMCTNYTSSISP
jgi:hypothetical protein